MLAGREYTIIIGIVKRQTDKRHMEHISTSALSNELNLKSSDLFNKLYAITSTRRKQIV